MNESKKIKKAKREERKRKKELQQLERVEIPDDEITVYKAEKWRTSKGN